MSRRRHDDGAIRTESKGMCWRLRRYNGDFLFSRWGRIDGRSESVSFLAEYSPLVLLSFDWTRTWSALGRC